MFKLKYAQKAFSLKLLLIIIVMQKNPMLLHASEEAPTSGSSIEQKSTPRRSRHKPPKHRQAPVGIANETGICYANATLQALFHLSGLNHFLMTYVDFFPSKSIIRTYLSLFQVYKEAKRVSLPLVYFSHGNLLNQRNEPTDLIQFMITEIQAQKIHSQEILQVIPLRLEELMATDNLLQKNLRPIKSQYALVILHNPRGMRYRLPAHSASMAIPLETRSYELKSIISASHLTTTNDLSRSSSWLQANHSTAYVKIGRHWFFCNDSIIAARPREHLGAFLSGKKTVERVRKNIDVVQISPGVLIYERKER